MFEHYWSILIDRTFKFFFVFKLMETDQSVMSKTNKGMT